MAWRRIGASVSAKAMKVSPRFLTLLAVLGAMTAGCGQGVALDVSASFRDATGAVVYTGGAGGREVNAATPPLSGSASFTAFVNGDGADPINVEAVAVEALTLTVPTESACAARAEGCGLGICTASVTWSWLGACALRVVASTAKGEVAQCVSFVLTRAGDGTFDAAAAQAVTLCGE